MTDILLTSSEIISGSAGYGGSIDDSYNNQSFTIPKNGTFNLSSLSIRLEKIGNPGNVDINIKEADVNGHPTGSPISTGQLLASSVTDTYTTFSVDMSAVSLTGNKKYVIEYIFRSCGDDNTMYIIVDNDDTYTGGTSFYYSSGWINNNYDIYFKLYGTASLTNDLISYYKMDSDATDSVGSNDGTVYGASVTTGKINQGYDFDGSNDYIQIPDTVSTAYNGKSFSYGGWFNSGTGLSGSVYEALIWDGSNGQPSSTSATRIHYVSDKLYFSTINIGEGWVSTSYTTTLTANKWYYIMAVYNASNKEQKLYLNGVEVATNTRGTALFNSYANNNFYIGKYKDTTTSPIPFDGKIDEVLVYSRALTSDEVTELYNSGNGNQYPFGDSGVTTRTADFTANASLQKRSYETFDATSYLNTTNEKTFNADSFLQLRKTETFISDAFIEKVGKQNFYSEAYLYKVNTSTFEADSFLKSADNKYTFTSDAFLERKTTSTFTADASLHKVLNGNFYANAYLHKITDTDFTANASLHKVTDKTFISEASLNKVTDKTFTSDAFLEKKNRTDFIADASLWQQKTKTFTSDAFLFKQFKYKPVIHNISDSHATASNVTEMPQIMWIEGDTE